ncbi:MAG: GDSL-type esterase/lipase family protein [Treponema sp.]|jgi:lysophospholipase L1-like esterase|nr:GDSL-type esterase/lipase family protein [Treponema sp.]
MRNLSINDNDDNNNTEGSAAWVTIFSQSLIPCGMIGRSAKLTTRLVVPVNVGGSALRLRFSNRPAKKESRLDEVHIAESDESGAIVLSTGRQVTFNGNKELVLAAGAEAVSDRIEMPLRAGQYLALSLYSAKQPHSANSLGSHGIRSRRGNYCTGNFEVDRREYLTGRLLKMPIDTTIPLFRGMDVLTQENPVVISCLGDSNTQQCRWYTPLLARLYRAYPGKAALLNAGISGNRLMKDSPPGWGNMFGAAGIKRVEYDSFADHGLSHILLALGTNDLFQAESRFDKTPPPAPEEFVGICRDMAEKIHARGLKVIAMTLYPISFDKAPVKEKLRLAYNDIIRGGVFDDYIDVEGVLKNPGKPGYRDGYAIADGVHLTEAGGKAAADSVDLAKFMGY